MTESDIQSAHKQARLEAEELLTQLKPERPTELRWYRQPDGTVEWQAVWKPLGRKVFERRSKSYRVGRWTKSYNVLRDVITIKDEPEGSNEHQA